LTFKLLGCLSRAMTPDDLPRPKGRVKQPEGLVLTDRFRG
jgi:hypothetical protein